MKNSNSKRAICTLASIAMLASAFAVTNARADTSKRTLMLSVFQDTTGADRVLAGNYNAAIREIKSQRRLSRNS